MIERVLVFTAVGPRGIEPETSQGIQSLAWHGSLLWLAQRDNPYGDDGRANILHQYRRARRLFLVSDCDAMLFVEADIIPPADALLKLAALNADVAYGVYCFRAGRKQWPYATPINIFSDDHAGPLRDKQLAAALARKTVRCGGAGFGCTLIKRPILERFDFRLEGTAHCDTWFTQDVFSSGAVMMADMSVICGHKDEDGVILWPPF